MLANYYQNIESRFRFAQSVFNCKVGIEWLKDLLDKICKAWSIESSANLIFCRNSNSVQTRLTCRVKYFTSSIKGKILTTFLKPLESCVLNILWDLEVFIFTHTFRVIKIKIHVKNFVIASIAAQRTLKKIWNIWLESQNYKYENLWLLWIKERSSLWAQSCHVVMIVSFLLEVVIRC